MLIAAGKKCNLAICKYTDHLKPNKEIPKIFRSLINHEHIICKNTAGSEIYSHLHHSVGASDLLVPTPMQVMDWIKAYIYKLNMS
jgi:hypothetical protein